MYMSLQSSSTSFLQGLRKHPRTRMIFLISSMCMALELVEVLLGLTLSKTGCVCVNTAWTYKNFNRSDYSLKSVSLWVVCGSANGCKFTSVYNRGRCAHWENCLHFVYALSACSFFNPPTALMHLKKWILCKCIQTDFFCTIRISLRIIIKDYIITQTLINETALNRGFNCVCNCKPKAAI